MTVLHRLQCAEKKEETKAEQLYSKYYKLMLYAAMELLNDQMAAEDAVHEAFIKIIKIWIK
ncbi:MAG: hypothetical protein MR443_03535 [Lachnospiraceae bacterium]|nr:hypothetical protein [Lachnospiraceae bacterium]